MSRRARKNNQEQNTNILMREFRPKTKNQHEYIRTVIESDVTVCYGPSGTGKSYCAIGLACEWLLSGKVDKILVSRSIVASGEVGWFPGDVDEKFAPYIMPYLDYFEWFLGSKFDSYLHQHKIKFIPVELLRGHTYHNTMMICDESQSVTPKQLKLFLTRLGQGSKAILIGDNKQSDINYNGLQFIIDKMQGIPGLNFAKLDNSDILRHPIIGDIINVFDRFDV